MELPKDAKPINPKLTAWHHACALRTGKPPEFFLVEDNAAVLTTEQRKAMAALMTPGSAGQTTILKGI